VVLAPFAYYMLRQGIPNAPLNPPFFFSADVLNLVIPTRITLIGGSAFQSVSDRFTGGDAGRTAYLGLPLIFVIALFSVSQWRRTAAKVLTILLAIILIASFGNRLHLAGITRIRLPWALFAHLPVVENALPVRFTMFAFLVAGAMVALWLVQGTGSPVMRWALVLLAAIFLLPNLFLRGWHSKVSIPSFFKQPLQARSLSTSRNVLVLPLKSGDPMIWQSVSDFSFRMAGGFTGPSPPHYIRSPALLELWNGRLPPTSREFLDLLRARNVGVVVVRDPSPLQGPLTTLLGVVPQRIGGLVLFRVPPAATPRGISR